MSNDISILLKILARRVHSVLWPGCLFRCLSSSHTKSLGTSVPEARVVLRRKGSCQWDRIELGLKILTVLQLAAIDY